MSLPELKISSEFNAGNLEPEEPGILNLITTIGGGRLGITGRLFYRLGRLGGRSRGGRSRRGGFGLSLPLRRGY